ncbi:MAG: lipocalin family protein [Bacteroidales bacterium]|nr:lipocalin family protein [Bacteroidales bacterium]
MKKTILILLVTMLFSSLLAQKNLSVVSSVDLNKYTGTWYEIARLPFSFESKLKCNTATYSLREDGRIAVLNKGYYISNPEKINTATGIAFVPDKNFPAKLKVQFFWPFRGNYWIMYLDTDYKYVLIGEPSLKYLWILAREKKLDETVLQMLLSKAADAGYNLTNLIRTEQDCN